MDDWGLRLMWAQEHLDVMRAELRLYLDTGPNYVEAQRDPKTGDYVFYGFTTRKPPSKILRESIAFINQLRSGLDNLAVSLGGKDLPVFEEDPASDPSVHRKWVFRTRGFKRKILTVLDDVQPYQRTRTGGDPKSDPLFLLNRLWNDDKHNRITAAAAVAVQSTIQMIGPLTISAKDGRPVSIGGVQVRSGPFKNGEEVSRFPWRNIEAEPKLDVKIAFAVAYGQVGPARGAPIDGLCQQLYHFVSEELVPRFTQFFPPR